MVRESYSAFVSRSEAQAMPVEGKVTAAHLLRDVLDDRLTESPRFTEP